MKAQASSLAEEVGFLGLTVDDKLKFESQIKKIYRKVSQQITVLKRMKKFLPLKLGEKRWRYQAAQLWNTIPNNLRNIDSYRSFKQGLKELNLVKL